MPGDVWKFLSIFDIDAPKIERTNLTEKNVMRRELLTSNCNSPNAWRGSNIWAKKTKQKKN